MAESKSIEKKRGEAPDFSFESLKREGIEFVQGLSGEIWTDYNLHDPGVTILEQLCYALTDLFYRTDFEVADFLTGKDGNIDFQGLSLHSPEKIFPCRPTTINDYRKVIFDVVSEIDNVWVTPNNDKYFNGLYTISVRLSQNAGELDRKEIIEKIQRVYFANRNLCEDIAEVKIAKELDCELFAQIEIKGKRFPNDILTEIYFKCAKHIASEIQFSSFEEEIKRGKTLEELFDGPLTKHGYIQEKSMGSDLGILKIADISKIIESIDGVESIKSLCINKNRKRYYDSIEIDDPYAALRLHIPQSDDEIQIKITKNGRDYPLSAKELRSKYGELYFSYQLQRHAYQDVAALYDLPQGQYRNFQQYYSIQNQFPSIYGIGDEGLRGSDYKEASKRAEAEGKAKQLKAYLLLFEQILAGFLSNLQNLDKLFSSDKSLKRSYFSQVLDNNSVPDVDDLYQGKLSEISKELEKILRKYDNFADRRNRLLDYLLALFGEKFTQNYLRHFNYDHSPEELEEVIIDNKIELLKNIVEVGRNRAGGFNYREQSWNTNNVSGMQFKVSLLLGFKKPYNRLMASETCDENINNQANEGLHIVEHLLLRPAGKNIHTNIKVSDDFYSLRLSVIFPRWTARLQDEKFRNIAEETVLLNCPAHVLPEFYWFGFDQMHQFENLYSAWLEQKICSEADPDKLNDQAEKLITFLIENHNGSVNGS